jgi:hypothetical protein
VDFLLLDASEYSDQIHIINYLNLLPTVNTVRIWASCLFLLP